MSKLTFVSDELRPEVISLNKDKILIVNSSSIGEELNSKDVNIVKEDNVSLFRPIRCSELLNKLSSRGWNMMGVKYLTFGLDQIIRNHLEPGNLTNSDYLTGILNIDTSSSENTVAKVGSPVSKFVREDEVDFINESYKKTFGDMDGTNEIWFYRSSKDSIDIPNGTIVKDIIDYGSDIYTNTVCFTEIARHAAHKDLSAKVDLTIQYTKMDRRASIETTGPHIYSRDITFEGFNNKDCKLTYNNFVEEIERDVNIEYINGILKVMPLTENVIECIIRKCTITYGNIK